MTARAAILAGAFLLGLSSHNADAVPLNPNDFAGSSLGLLTGGPITLDTDTLGFSGGGSGTFVDQGGGPFNEGGGGPPGIAVFLFDDGSVLGDVTIVGSNAAAILFLGSATVSGSIDISAPPSPAGSAPGVAGPGGGRGGHGFNGSRNPDDSFVLESGFGPGGGLHGRTSNGSFFGTPGGGGGFGTPGGNGSTIGLGGPAHGDLITVLEGGSGGGGGGGFLGFNFNGGSGGGGGGGALEIGALGSLVFDGALVSADGGDSTLSFHNPGTAQEKPRIGGGGGSGGGLLFHGFDITVDVDSIITADGGNGGGQGGITGGCGGGGLITFLSNTAGSFANDGLVQADPGNGVGDCDPLSTNIAFLTSPDIGEDPGQSSGSQVPEPASGILIATGLAGLLLRRRKRH